MNCRIQKNILSPCWTFCWSWKDHEDVLFRNPTPILVAWPVKRVRRTSWVHKSNQCIRVCFWDFRNISNPPLIFINASNILARLKTLDLQRWHSWLSTLSYFGHKKSGVIWNSTHSHVLEIKWDKLVVFTCSSNSWSIFKTFFLCNPFWVNFILWYKQKQQVQQGDSMFFWIRQFISSAKNLTHWDSDKFFYNSLRLCKFVVCV